jgi:intein/homing endonuclease
MCENGGNSDFLKEITEEDYEEIPVSIDQFIEDERYIGKVTGKGETVYPFWRDILRKLFDPKNNYTECLTGDTLIPLLNGTAIQIKDLVSKVSSGEKCYVYSYDLDLNSFAPGLVTVGKCLGKRDVYRVTLDNGKSFEATSTHRVLTRDKHYVMVKNLIPGQSLMPLIREDNGSGYEILLSPQKDGTFTKELTHRVVIRYKGVSAKGVVHHKDFNKRNNYPNNLCRVSWSAHRHYHALKGSYQLSKWRESLDCEDYKRIVRERTSKGLKSRWSDTSQHKRSAIRMKKLDDKGLAQSASLAFWNSAAGSARKDLMRKRISKYNSTSHPNLLKISKEDTVKAISNCFNINIAAKNLGISQTGIRSLIKKYNIDVDSIIKHCAIKFPNKYWSSRFSIFNKLYNEYGYINDDLVISLRKLKGYKTLPLPSKVADEYFEGNYSEFVSVISNYNHKVTKIEYIGNKDVYDIEVDRYHNFALDCGIISSNCILSGSIGPLNA